MRTSTDAGEELERKNRQLFGQQKVLFGVLGEQLHSALNSCSRTLRATKRSGKKHSNTMLSNRGASASKRRRAAN